MLESVTETSLYFYNISIGVINSSLNHVKASRCFVNDKNHNTFECFEMVWPQNTMIIGDSQFSLLLVQLSLTNGLLWRRLYERNWFTSRLCQNQTVLLLGSVK